MTTSRASLGRILVACGAVLVVTAATAGAAFFGLATWLTSAPLAAGTILVVAGVALGARPRRSRLVLECAAVVAGAVAVNVLALQVPVSVDVTASKRNTLTESSAQLAQSLTMDVVVRATLDDDRAFAELELLVDRYRRHTSRIALERVRRDAQGSATTRGVVVVAGERRVEVRLDAAAADAEAELTRAIRAVTTSTRPRVYVLAGHGEPALSDDTPAGLRRLGQALVDEGLAVVPLPLDVAGRVPDDAAAVVVAAPRSAVPAAELASITRYVDEGGGRLLVLVEPGVDSGLASLLGRFGVQADDDVVVDGSAFAGVLGAATATGAAYGAHPVTSRLGGALTHFGRARSLSFIPGPDVVELALVQTGAEAFGDMNANNARDAADVAGPVTLAYAVSDRAAQVGRGARVVVVGDATFATNEAVGLGANRDFAVNAVLWLASTGDDEIAQRPRGRGGNLLLLTPTSRERIAFVLLYGLPVALLCAGLAISGARRRR